MNVKLDISNWNFFPVQTKKKIKLDISNWRMSKLPKIPVQIDRRYVSLIRACNKVLYQLVYIGKKFVFLKKNLGI